ncbi:MAG: TonB-dependent receptor plug domain-containing protein [Rikenellaceae bacterium]|nr:TonB-dependent receptor plug domain-containing protein [Rikenellaceae bacterium]
MAQVRVTGKVVDSEDGSPVAFATVTVKGTTVGVITNAGGDYNISVPGTSGVLVFSSIGYTTREETLGQRTTVNVRLDKSSVDIDEVVVTGFGDVKKETFTGSSVKLNASDLELAGTTDVSRMLEGKVAGVSIQNVSSTFGAAPKVRIRGVTSISGENKPLWVVDGVVLEDIVQISNDQLSSGDPATLLGSSVAGLNPNDIATFDILKDATATALYGARAMNGVIVITTKRGRPESLRLPTTRISRSARSRATRISTS